MPTLTAPPLGTRAASSVDRLSLLLLWLVSAAGALLLYMVFSNFAFEDAYITYRYARNVAAGAGYVFTEGERVFGATSPLHTLILAFFAKLGAPVPQAANVLYAASCAGIAVCGGCILRLLRSPYAAVVFALLIFGGAGRLYNSWGLETPTLLLLVLGSVLSAMKEKDDLAGFLAGLAFLTRYDSALFAILLFTFMAFRRKRIPWRPGLIALAVVLPWLLFAQFYFGSVMPNTLGAKMGKNSLLHYLEASGIAQLNSLWRPLMLNFVRQFQWEPEDTYLGGALAFSVLVSLFSIRRNVYVGLLLLYPLALWLGYSIIGPPAEFTWYLRPAILCVLLLGVVGLSSLVPEGASSKLRLTATALVALAGICTFPHLMGTQNGRLVNDPNYTGRVGSYSQIADWILEKELDEETLLCTEPGYLTFKTDNPAIDPIGLVTKRDVPKAENKNEPSLVTWVRHFQPGIVVGSLPLRFHGYASAFAAYPHKFVQIRSEVHREHFEELHASFQNAAAISSASAEETPIRHPFSWSVGDLTLEEWESWGGRPARKVKRPEDLILLGKPYEDPVFSLVKARSGAESPPFLIDFDRLTFRFTGTSPQATVAQLLIQDQIVFEEGPIVLKMPQSPEAKTPEAQLFRTSSWPVGLFRGQTAKLRLVHTAGRPKQWLAIDQVKSVRTEEAILLDGFEDLSGYSDFWLETPTDRPTDLTEVAKDYGVHFAYSKGAATTMGHRGRHTLLSRPFTIERDLIHMLVFDFCSANASGVQLLIDGEVRREHRTLEYGVLRPLTWQVYAFRGQEAQIRVFDGRLGAEYWLGIDELMMSDE